MKQSFAAAARARAFGVSVGLAAVAFFMGCGVRGRSSAPRAPRAPAPAAVAPAADSAARQSKRPDSVTLAKKDSVTAVAIPDSAGKGIPAADSAGKAPADSATKPAAPAKPAKAKKPATRDCLLDFSDSPPETRLVYSRVSEGISNTFIGGGFVGHCQGENNRLRADSAEQFQQIGVVNLYGNVVYAEPNKVEITASHATYFTKEGRLYADGNVVAKQLATGSTFSGPSIEYYRATPERPVSRMIAPMRSTASVVEKDSSGKPLPAVTITANRFEDAGDSLVMAWGDVQIDRDKINGRADSSSFDKITQKARLVRGARIINKDSAQRFTLVGDTIDLYTTDRKLDRVDARHKANATSEQLVLTAERIDLRLKDQQLDEAFAFGPGRAKATTTQQDVEADSLRIRLVDRQVREMRAVGGARAIGAPDSVKMKTTEKDILRGDSVFAFFDSTAVADTARRAKLREIQAMGNASSLFHVANSKGRDAPPGINYVRGAYIFVHFDTGAVRDVRVDSAASGVYLEAAPDSTAEIARQTKSGSGQPSTRPPVPPTRRPPPVSLMEPGVPDRPPSSPSSTPTLAAWPSDSRRRK